MKKINPVNQRLKETTLAIIEEMYCSGKYSSYALACKDFYNKIQTKKQNSGFPQSTFQKFYSNYRMFKSKIYKNIRIKTV